MCVSNATFVRLSNPFLLLLSILSWALFSITGLTTVFELLTSFLSAMMGVSQLNAVGWDKILYDLKFYLAVHFSNTVCFQECFFDLIIEFFSLKFNNKPSYEKTLMDILFGVLTTFR